MPLEGEQIYQITESTKTPVIQVFHNGKWVFSRWPTIDEITAGRISDDETATKELPLLCDVSGYGSDTKSPVMQIQMLCEEALMGEKPTEIFRESDIYSGDCCCRCCGRRCRR